MKLIRNFKGNTFFRFLAFMKPRWVLYSVCLVILSFVYFLYQFSIAFGIKGIADAGINHDMNVLTKSIILMVGAIIVFICIITPIVVYFFSSTIFKTLGDIQKYVFDHVQKLPMSYIERNHSGDIISRLNNDIFVSLGVYSSLRPLLGSIVSFIGSATTIFILNAKLGAIAIALGFLKVLANSVFMKCLRSSGTSMQEALGRSSQKIVDMLSGISVIKLFNLHARIADEYRGTNDHVRKCSLKQAKQNTLLNGVNSIFDFMNFTGMIVIGGIMVSKGQLTFGILMAIVQLMNSLFWFFNEVGGLLTGIQASLAGADRIFEILDIPKEDMFSTSIMYKITDNKEETAISFKDVCFSYNVNNIVLKDLNLEVKKGSTVAIVGASGGGKSTVFKLLLGFHKLTSGWVNIFGHSINSYDIGQLRDLISYVPQDSFLFSASIAENIAFGKPGVDMDSIIAAVKAANAHDFIMELPDGYSTKVGDSGCLLSGGQRQRIAIARALIKDAPILLLDEATSALDYESERQVQNALGTLMEGRTTLVIAHRLKTIEKADIIMVLENGSIIESGNHESLLEKKGRYCELYKLQFKNDESSV